MSTGKTLIIETTITQLQDRMKGLIQPTAPRWEIVNDGDTRFWLENHYVIEPGDRFGIDATDVVAHCLGADIPVNNNTQFTFEYESPFTYQRDLPIFYSIALAIANLLKKRSAQLIQTNFKMINE